MSLSRLRKLVPPTGPVLSLTLVGLLLLSSLLYYKAVKAQREAYSRKLFILVTVLA